MDYQNRFVCEKMMLYILPISTAHLEHTQRGLNSSFSHNSTIKNWAVQPQNSLDKTALQPSCLLVLGQREGNIRRISISAPNTSACKWRVATSCPCSSNTSLPSSFRDINSRPLCRSRQCEFCSSAHTSCRSWISFALFNRARNTSTDG
jgi:hypothetical protein